MLPTKSGVIVDDWDALRADIQASARFLDQIRPLGSVIILSLTRSAAATTILRDVLPQSFVCDISILSRTRLTYLVDYLFVFDGQSLVKQPVQRREAFAPRFGLAVSNGYGLGHVTRMKAVGEGLQQFGPVSFMSFSAAMTKGFFYLPSPQYLGLPDEDARIYVHEASLRFFNTFDPTHIVYDGNVVPTGLLSALALRPDIHLTWIRRGQWQPDAAPKFMAQQALADLVIEPGDVSDLYDTGPTWKQRFDYVPSRAFLKTKPIMPANPPMLSRIAAQAALRLDPAHKYVLLMPGACQKAEDLIVVQQAAAAIQAVEMIPVLAHWPMSHDAPPDIEGAITLEVMPIAQYYRAFDAIVSASGYNSFHELLDIDVPVIFIPQDDAGRDQQIARAQYAVDHGRAAMCKRNALGLISDLLLVLEAPKHKPIAWHNDWSQVAEAMEIGAGATGEIEVLPAQTMPPAKWFKAVHKRWLKNHKPFHTQFVLALDIDDAAFMAKKIDHANIIVTNSIDPILLRRSGYQYVWLNNLPGYAIRRQFLNFLRVFRPARIKSI